MDSQKDLYFVAVKLFLKDGQGNILLTKDRFGDWDLPGGRIKPDEFETALEQILTRKMKEELGSELKYKLGQPVIFMRHERNEILASGEREKRRIFAVGYEAEYLGGDIQLGKNHEKFEWFSLQNGKSEDYLTGGWLKGVQDYILLSKSTS